MQLTPRQLSSLNEMGIPVWEFRSTKAEKTAGVVAEIIVQQPSEQLLNCDWVVMIDHNHYGEQAQRLLYAMLLSMGIEEHQFAIIDVKYSVQLQNIDSKRKVLIVLGNDIAKELLGEPLVPGTIHKILNSQISTIISFSLDDLLENPQNKVHAWQDLQLAKQALF